MPAGSKIQICEDGSSGAEHLSYDDRQSVLNAGNVQKALEKVAADVSSKAKYHKIVDVDSYDLFIEEGWVVFPDTGAYVRPLGEDIWITRITLAKQGRFAVLDVALGFDYISQIFFEQCISQNSDFGWLFTITREDFKPARKTPAFIYRRDKQGDGITGLEYTASKSTVGIDPDGKVSVRYIDESWLEYIEFKAIYITAK